MSNFTDLINSNKAILFDGAIGTEIYKSGIYINKCFEEVNLSNKDIIEKIHLSYIQAGSQVITTNTWGGNRFKLEKHNLRDKLEEINRSGVSIAKSAAEKFNSQNPTASGVDNQIFVAGSMGPLGVHVEPWGKISFNEVYETYQEQAGVLIDEGVDGIILETFTDDRALLKAIEAVYDLNPSIPILAFITINENFQTPLGTPLVKSMEGLNTSKAAVVGLNCSLGPALMLSAVKKIQPFIKKPMGIMPNAGLPKDVEGRQIYMCQPDYMAKFTKDFLKHGVRIIGGCCGTDPDHIRSIKNAINQSNAFSAGAAAGEKSTGGASGSSGGNGGTSSITGGDGVHAFQVDKGDVQYTPTPMEEKSVWANRITKNEKVISVELLPPHELHLDKMIEKATKLKIRGATAINIPDGPRAKARMSALLTAVQIENIVKIETILHYTCRDRNILGMQSDLIGFNSCGLRNILLVTGDPPKIGDYPFATGVFDVDAIGLTNIVNRLNWGQDIGGKDIGGVTNISPGVASNPVAQNLDLEFKRFKYKVEAGAEWTITQPIFKKEALDKFIEFQEKEKIRIPTVLGIWPIVSYRNALFLNNEVPGIEIPKPIINKFEKYSKKEDAIKLGIEYAQKIIESCWNDIHGIQIAAPFGNIDIPIEVLNL